MDQLEAPLFKALRQHLRRGYAHLHVPAHRQGRAMSSLFKKALFQMDLTELPGLDNLHACCPGGPIAKAQELAARLFGAQATFFLVNGSTVGLQALMLAACRPGEEIIVSRDSHRSVLAGLILSGADPVFLETEFLDGFEVPATVSPKRLARVLREHPQARGVFTVYPSYYGIASDLRSLVELAHKEGKYIFVDEAHGAHFPFHPGLPAEALTCGADAAVMSVHKTGGSLTQTSFLHLKGGRLEPARVAGALSLLQTSSPSYLLMASLDLARRQLAARGRALLQKNLALAEKTRFALEKIPGLDILSERHLPEHYRLDPLRITVNVRQLGLSGYQVAGLLSEKYKVNCELADYYNLVAVVGLGVDWRDCRRLVQGLKEISGQFGRAGDKGLKIPAPPAVAKKRLTPREAWFSPVRAVPLKDSAGLICAEWVGACPPGIPVIWPGEEITADIVEYLQYLKSHQAPVAGPADNSLVNIRVVAE